ncbi:pre-mRNA-splicing factor 38B-like isoform X2 [Schistocerca gregaria]|uniref:pre-mRNA-splicing factor 38B-like isoform X2 n=1 Tax=Schistocerca gregaria TaxID=7010 RepID=UPI00211DBBA4|nr:pre-mRNA-splicing factor 38B-like isoform X2 [Schistocerca gregaria]
MVMEKYDDTNWLDRSPGQEEEKKTHAQKLEKKNNILPLWGNERTMNLNPLILTNIQSSHYFKVNLYELKTYHEVIDEIYYKVTHLEPWEKGSRKTAGQTGMCGGVRGVGAGGIVSTAYCLLYKLFTLKLTRKQVNGLLTHPDSPYIRGLGFMYIRYTQPPQDLWDWYDPYLEDPEEMDVKAGGGQVMTIGDMLRAFLTKLEWFSTLFPRIPVPIQQKLEKKMLERFPPVVSPSRPLKQSLPPLQSSKEARHIPDDEVSFGEAERFSRLRRTDAPPPRERRQSPDRARSKERERDRRRAYSSERRSSREKHHRNSRERRSSYSRERSPLRHRERTHVHRTKNGRETPVRRSSPDDFAAELRREKERQKREREKERERERERDKEKDRHRDKDRDRERDREREREKLRERDRSRDRAHERSRVWDREDSRDKDRSRDKDKDLDRAYDKERDYSRETRHKRKRS